MAESYIGEIRMFAGNFAPAGWSFCDGSLIPIADNEVLFTLLGTIYGGDGQTTFALPNLQSRIPIHQGVDSQGNAYVIGETGGSEAVTLTPNQIAAHSHTLYGSTDAASSRSPVGAVLASAERPVYGSGLNSALASQAISSVGGNQPHDNRQPFLCVNFIISLFGIYPSQN